MTTGDRLRPFAIRRIGLLDPPRSAAAGIKDPRQRSRALDPRPGGVGQIWTKASRRDSTTYIYRRRPGCRTVSEPGRQVGQPRREEADAVEGWGTPGI